MEKYTPVILDEQATILKWARKKYQNHISFSTIVEYLISDKICISDVISEGLEEMRAIYKKYNNAWREQLLNALVLNRYQLQNDIQKNQAVTNGNLIGFSDNLDFTKRQFSLYTAKDKLACLGTFKIDDFWRV